MKLKYKIIYGVLLVALIILVTCALFSSASDLDQYRGKTAAQLSAMVDYQTIANTVYWNTHAYAQIKAIIDAMDSTGVDSANALNGIRESADYGYSIDSVVTGAINDYPCPASKQAGAVYMHGTVFLNDTTEWIVDKTIVVDNSDSGLHIIGSPGYILRQTKTSGADSCFTPIIDIRAEGCNVEIEGFEIEGWANHDPDPAKYSNGYDAGIAIHGANHIKIHDMYIHDVGGDGISIARNQWRTPDDGHRTDIPQKIWIYNNVIDVWNRNFPEGQIIGRGGIGITGGKEIYIHHNYFIGGERVAGIDLEPDDADDIINKVMIQDNIFEGYNGSDNGSLIGVDYVGSAIAITGYGYTKLHSIDISGNVIFNYVNDGVYLQVGGDTGGFGYANQQYKVSDNFIMGCRSHGIALFSVRAVQVINNDISYNGSAGILVGAATQDVQISSNKIYRNLHNGIWVNSSGTNDASGIQIDGNYVFDNGLYYPTSSAGIKVENADRVSITNNAIYETRGKYLDKWDRYYNGANQDTDGDYNNAYSDMHGVTQYQSIVCNNVTNLKVLGNNEWGHPRKITVYDTTNVSDFTVDSTVLALRAHGYLLSAYNPWYSGSLVDNVSMDAVTSTYPLDAYTLGGYFVYNMSKFVRDPGSVDSLVFLEIRDNTALTGTYPNDTLTVSFDVQQITTMGTMGWLNNDEVYIVSIGKVTNVVDTTGNHYLEVAGIQGFFADGDGLYQLQVGPLVSDSIIADQGSSCSFINCQMTGFNEWENKTGVNPQPQEMGSHINFQVRDPLTNIRTDITSGVITPNMNNVYNRIDINGGQLDLRGHTNVALQISDSTDFAEDDSSDVIFVVGRQNGLVNVAQAKAPLALCPVDTVLLNTGNSFSTNASGGWVVFDSVYNVLKYWNGTAWIQPIDSTGLGTGPVPLPVYTNAEMAAIASPQPGWALYNSDDSLVHYYDTDGWVAIPITDAALDTVLVSSVHDVTRYGAAGDSTTNDYTAIIAAIAAADSGDIIYFPWGATGQYRFSAELAITKSLNIIAADGVTLYPGAHRAFNCYGGISGTTTTMADSCNSGAFEIEMTDYSTFNTGDLIQLRSATNWYVTASVTPKKGELHIINDKLAGGIVKLDGGTYDTYRGTETVTISRLIPIKVSIKNVKIVYASNYYGASAVCLDRTINSTIDNVTVSNNGLTGIDLYRCYNTRISNCTIDRANYDGQGYGIAFYGSYKTEITGCIFRRCRKGVSASCGASAAYILSRIANIHHNEFTGGGMNYNDTADMWGEDTYAGWSGGQAAFDTHEGSELINFDYNVIKNAYYGVMIRSNQVNFTNNKIYGKGYAAVYQYRGRSNDISNNVLESVHQYRTGLDGTTLADSAYLYFYLLNSTVMADLDSGRAVLSLKNNTSNHTRIAFIGLAGSWAGVTCWNLFANNNTVFLNYGSTTYFLKSTGGGAITLRNCTFKDNVINDRTGSYVYKHNVITMTNCVNEYSVFSSLTSVNNDNVVDLLRIGSAGTKFKTVVEDTADGVRHFLQFRTAGGDTLYVPAFFSADTSGVVTW